MSENKPQKLTDEVLAQELTSLPEWKLEGSGEARLLAREFKFADFVAAMVFVNRLAGEAESAGHHPDIDIRYNKVRVALVTHDAGGITQKDVALARIASGLI